MKATIAYVKRKFDEFNKLCFAGRLPELPIELSNAKGFLGVCRYNLRKRADGTVEAYNFRLSINNRIDLPEQVIEDTIIHEMIHYFIGVNGLEDVSSHGPIFRHLMNSINNKYGRHIAVSHKVTEVQREQSFDKRPHWHVVAVVKLKNGQIGIKVIPRIIQRILEYKKGVLNTGEVESLDFFLSNDPFFNRFPKSASLRIECLSMEEITMHLTEAHSLTVSENDVVVLE